MEIKMMNDDEHDENYNGEEGKEVEEGEEN